MIIKNVTLQNFRSFAKKEIEFDEKTTIIVGQNTAGKTNILEAVNLLSTGKSFRASLEQEMIKTGEELARVSGRCEVGSEKMEAGEKWNLEVVLTRGILHGTKIPNKKLSINGSSKLFSTFVGNLKTVLFGPQDLDLVTGAPTLRRKFLDNVCSQVDREYRRSILSYEKGLRQRNRLLQRIREGEAKPSQLFFWNNLLVKNGDYITNFREELINFINISAPLNDEELSLEYDKSVISPERINNYANQEIAAGVTLVGPHRDDYIFKEQRTIQSAQEEWRDLSIYGSRGEQRMAVLWLKLAELTFIEGKTGEKPVLLLDDIFSELDHKHVEVVLKIVDKQQTIITTADPHTIEDWKKNAQIIEL